MRNWFGGSWLAPIRPGDNKSRTKSCSSGSAALVALLVSTVALGSQAMVPVPAVAQSKPAPLPALASEPAPEPAARIATGDFVNPPLHPADVEARAGEPKAPSFDPARSRVDNTETTATERVWDNPDGTKTVDLSTRPLRYQIASGEWREFDLSVVANRDGTLRAKDAPGAATLGATANADAATIATSAGPIILRHPDAAPVNRHQGRCHLPQGPPRWPRPRPRPHPRRRGGDSGPP